MLAGCSAGFLNSVKIKGSHTALKSGMVAGEEIFKALTSTDEEACAETYMLPEGFVPQEVGSYQTAMEDSWVYEELKEVRNCHASFHAGTIPGMIYTGISTLFLKGTGCWTPTPTPPHTRTHARARSSNAPSYTLTIYQAALWAGWPCFFASLSHPCAVRPLDLVLWSRSGAVDVCQLAARRCQNWDGR